MRIRTKLILGYISVSILVALIGMVTYQTLDDIEKEFDEVIHEMIPVIETLEELQIRALQIVSSSFGFGLIATELRNNEGIANAEQALEEERQELPISSYYQTLKQMEDLAAEHSPEYDDFMSEIKPQGEKLIQLSQQLVEMKEKGVTGVEILEIEEKLEGQAKTFLSKVDSVVSHEKEEAHEISEDLHSDILEALQRFFMITAITFLVAITLGIVISQTIAKPIMYLTKATAEIAKAKFDTRVEVSSDDEVGELAQSFNQMAEDLSRTTVSKTYFESIVNSMNSSLMVLTAEGIIKEVNETTCYFLGYHADELLGQSYEMVIDKDQFFQESMIDSLSFLGFTNNVEIIYLTKDGEKMTVMFSGSTITDVDGQIGGYVCVAQNITDLHRPEAKKKQT